MKTYAWLAEDVLTVGTLWAYRNDWESTRYSGNGISDKLWDGASLWQVNVQQGGVEVDQGDGSPYKEYGTLILVNDKGEDGEAVNYSIDLDA